MIRSIAVSLLLAACVSGRTLNEKSEASADPERLPVYQQQPLRQEDEDTVIALGSGKDGYEVTGMLQNFQLDRGELDPINSLLDRPQTSYLDVSWSNWIDQRLEMLDLFQTLLTPPVPRPRCSKMQSQGSSLDNGMVSYLASSRFGPAILTTYSQKMGEDGEGDFDYGDVYIPTGESHRKSYEAASLLEEMSADADKAFQMAELESSRSRQPKQTNVGYFGANLKVPSEKAMYLNSIDGDAESLQPIILAHPNLLNLVQKRPEDRDTQELQLNTNANHVSGIEMEESWAYDSDQAQYVLFALLLAGCLYVWISLAVSCCRMCRDLKKQEEGPADSKVDLLVPLLPEGAIKIGSIEDASSYAAPHGALMNNTHIAEASS